MRRSITTIGAAVLVVGTVGVGSASGAPKGPGARCAYDSATRVLTVVVKRSEDPIFGGLPDGFIPGLPKYRGGVAEILRAEDAIVVRAGAEPREVPCTGELPTIFNTDLVRVGRARNVRFAELYLDMSEGLFAPGATDEGDGGSEIEFELDVGEPDGTLLIVMSESADHVTVGTNLGVASMNLNADELQPDADLTATRNPAVSGGAGADVLDARPGLAGFDGPVAGARSRGVSFVGGGGNDRLFGSDLGDGLFPGGGQDRVEGGGGNEYIVSFDGMKDVIDCGPGRDDFNVIDHHDRLHRCGDREFGDPFSDFKQRLRLPFAP